MLRKKRIKRVSPKRVKVRNNKARKTEKRRPIFSISKIICSSLIVFAGFISLSFAIIYFGRQLRPLIQNERLKLLCTYQLGEPKSQNYKDTKFKLEKLVGDSKKFCKNFLLPKEQNKKLRIIPIIENILFRFI